MNKTKIEQAKALLQECLLRPEIASSDLGARIAKLVAGIGEGPDPERFVEALRSQLGYIQNGSGTTVRIFQDDATGDFFAVKGRSIPPKEIAWGKNWDRLQEEFIKHDDVYPGHG